MIFAMARKKAPEGASLEGQANCSVDLEEGYLFDETLFVEV